MDMKTVILSYIISNAICAVIMAVLWFQNRHRFEGLGFWLADYFLQLAGLLLIALHGVVPDFLSMTVGNLSVVGGTILLFIGLERFIGKRGTQIQNVILLVIFTLVHAYFTIVYPSLTWRNLNLSLGLFLICFQCAWLLLRRVDVETRTFTRSLGVLFGIYCLVSFARIYVDLANSVSNDLFRSNVYDTSIVMIYQMLFIAITFNLSLMVNRRLALDLAREIIERKRTESALLIKEMAIESSIEAIAISDLSGHLTYVNPAFLKLWGYQNSMEVLGRNVMEFWQVRENAEQVISRLPKLGNWSDEAVAKRKNGSTFDAKISANTILDSMSKPSALLAVSVDITEQNKTEEVIRLRLRLLEFAATHSLEEIMQNALDEIGQITGSPVGFYHFVEADQKTLSLQAWSTRTQQEFCQAEGRGLHYSLDKAGVWADCVRQRKPIIHNDYSALSHHKGLPPGHAEVIRELVVPILRKGRVVSILGVGNKPSDYDEKDVDLVAYVADVVWEIVDRKRAGDEIFHLSSFSQLNPNPVLEVDASGAITFCNEATFNILTRMGLNDPGVFIPADIDIIQELKDGTTIQIYREITIKDVTIEETIHFAREFNSVRIYANDITERKKTEEKLRQLSRAVEQSPASIVITDTSGKIEYVNPRFTQVTGYSFEEVIGQNPRVLNSGQTPPETYPKLWEALTSGKEWRGEFVNRKKSGEVYYESATISPITDAQGVITHYLAVKEDITEQKKAARLLQIANEELQTQLGQILGLQAILREQAIRDPLTGLYNRRFLAETLERELARAVRENYPVSFVMIDIDHFKNVNDQFGHDVGDLVLQNLSKQFSKHTRSGDIVCRYGGEEFLLVLPNTTAEAAFQSAERWRDVFQNSKVQFGNSEIRATLSLGVATFPTHGATGKEILAAADSAMYLAKSRGRNRVMLPMKITNNVPG